MKTAIDLSVHAYCYTLPGNWTVFAGKTDQDNDILSFEVARSRDIWFHVHGMPGSHVVLMAHECEGNPPPDIIKAAASIAAYHSKARQGGIVSVVYTRVCNVRKPRGAKPGTVTVRKEKVVKVRPLLPHTCDNGQTNR
ncbi:MAG: NFACT RNA binding domain-containing protein [Desulfobacterota bacterium]|nr:NFACT RNA binding domain-containing protein [Thermodesulfobacteriota bacterium]